MDDPLLPRELMNRLEAMALHGSRVPNGIAGGHTRSRFGGTGQELLDHRHFYPGDDLRSVNWQAYLRFERYFLRTFHSEPRVPVRILLDTSASMETGGKAQRARQLAAAISYVALVRLECVTVQPFAERLKKPISASGGRTRYQGLDAFLSTVSFGGQTDFEALARAYGDAYSCSGAAILISDFFDNAGESIKAIDRLGSMGHDLSIVQIWADHERTPKVRGLLELTDVESGAKRDLFVGAEAAELYTARFDEHSRNLERTARRHLGRYLGQSVSASLEDMLFGEPRLMVAAR